MRKYMEYKIISGRTVEVRRVMMDCSARSGPKIRRGTRVKGRTSLQKILANEREAVKNLARILNCNFSQGDMWVTLTYPDDRLPAGREEAKKDMEKTLRKLRLAFRKEYGRNPKYVVATGSVDPRTGEQVRYHHHIVMEALAYEAITGFWPGEDVSYRRLDGRGDYTGIARYMVQNSADRGDGERRWSCSRGLKKPIYTEPVPVKPGEKIYIPRNASLKQKNSFEDDETGMCSEYVRYTKARTVMRN